MPGKSSIDLTALTPDEPAKPPRPHSDLFHPEIFEPVNRLIVFTKACIEVIVFALAFLSVSVLNQQEFREEPVADSISRNSFLPRRCFWSSGLLGVPAVRLDFSKGDGWFPTHFDFAFVAYFGPFIRPVSIIVSRPPAWRPSTRNFAARVAMIQKQT